MEIQLINDKPAVGNQVFLIAATAALRQLPLNENELAYVQAKLTDAPGLLTLNRLGRWIFIVAIDGGKAQNQQVELWRRRGNELAAIAKKEKIRAIEIHAADTGKGPLLAFAEGLALGNYAFTKYFTDGQAKQQYLSEVTLVHGDIAPADIERLKAIIDSVTLVRDMVNEPVVSLNALKLAERFGEMGREAGFTTEVLHQNQIESLRMGGLLAVNKGSIDPATFSILEWKPETALNSRPIILVGKGVVFDTGGLSLKPTPQSMDYMKSDMAGGAAVAGVIYLAARLKLPLYLMALVPATDNRPDGNAITPGDVITMHNGTTVEVLNTDAEGRLILADALSFARNYHPDLVIDVATLTGSAAMALSTQGIAGMGSAGAETMARLQQAGDEVYERVVEFPLWDEYDEMIKSDIADVKNIGSREAGAITAGKFLQRFTAYPWVHLDIAGPSFLPSADHYRPKGGSGTGVRLLFRFLENYVESIRPKADKLE